MSGIGSCSRSALLGTVLASHPGGGGWSRLPDDRASPDRGETPRGDDERVGCEPLQAARPARPEPRMDPPVRRKDDQVGPGLLGLERQGGEDGGPDQDLELRRRRVADERPRALEVLGRELAHHAVPVAGADVAAARGLRLGHRDRDDRQARGRRDAAAARRTAAAPRREFS